jgi:hypothetical protein
VVVAEAVGEVAGAGEQPTVKRTRSIIKSFIV